MYSKEELNNMDKDIKVKKFLKLIYRGFDEENEYIRIFQNNDRKEYSKVNYFNDIDAVVNYVTGNNKFDKNTYFELATCNGNSGKKEDLLYRYCLGFDFDKKDLGEDFDSYDILNIFQQNKIHFHCLIDSGNGYHVYVCINKTNDLEKVEQVQRTLSNKLNSDLNAIKDTQILRVPYTYNIKDENKTKLVRIVAMDDRNEITPYDIDFLYNKNCRSVVDRDNKKVKYIMNNIKVPKCIENIINNGTTEGDRYNDLQKIVVILRQRNKPFDDIMTLCKSWAEKSNYNDNIEYRVKNIYENRKYISLNCKECDLKHECYHFIESEFDFDKLADEDGVIYPVYNLEDKITKKIRNKQNGGKRMLNGNEILILNVLRNEYENPRPLTKDGMDFKLLIRSITCKGKSCLSEKTVRETLKTLLDKNFIIEIKGARNKKTYKFNPIKTTLDKTIKVSYFATAMCIGGLINTSELALYMLIRQLHKQQLEDNKTKGNIFVLSQSDIAKKYYGNNTTENTTHISKMIKNLIDCHILDIYDIGTSSNNSFSYYRYRLNS